MDVTDYPRHGAVISEDEKYRYVLTRWFHDELDFSGIGDKGDRHRHLPFIMHNSSTADGREDDHTIAKCCGFAMRLSYGGIVVGNLYGARARDPKALFHHPDPVGPNNDAWLARIFATIPTGGTVIVAWGSLKGPGKDERVAKVVQMADDAGVVLKALKVSAGDSRRPGTPHHPLLLPYDLTPQLWRP